MEAANDPVQKKIRFYRILEEIATFGKMIGEAITGETKQVQEDPILV